MNLNRVGKSKICATLHFAHPTRLTYDENGSEITYVSNTVNEYTDIQGVTPEYDSAGNLAKDHNSYDYYYDAENKLTHIEDSSSNDVADYEYDALEDCDK